MHQNACRDASPFPLGQRMGGVGLGATSGEVNYKKDFRKGWRVKQRCVQNAT